MNNRRRNASTRDVILVETNLILSSRVIPYLISFPSASCPHINIEGETAEIVKYADLVGKVRPTLFLNSVPRSLAIDSMNITTIFRNRIRATASRSDPSFSGSCKTPFSYIPREDAPKYQVRQMKWDGMGLKTKSRRSPSWRLLTGWILEMKMRHSDPSVRLTESFPTLLATFHE